MKVGEVGRIAGFAVLVCGVGCGDVEEKGVDGGGDDGADASAAMADAGSEPGADGMSSGPDGGVETQNIGWSEDFGTAATIGSGYVTGFQIQVGGASTLQGFGIIGKQTGAQIKMGLYSEAGGEPDALLASTDPFDLIDGKKEIDPVEADVSLPAGNYWLMAAPSATVEVGTNENIDVSLRYASVPFADAMPDPLPDASSSVNPAFNLYIVVAAQ